MQVIKLQPKQKDNLLEMANKLFPEEGIFFTINNGKLYYSKDGKYPGKSIHWFEFLYTFLAEKIVGCTYNLVRALDEENSGEHPVDYLYEQFLKLK